MSISGISSNCSSTVRSLLSKIQEDGGITKSQLTSLQNSSSDSESSISQLVDSFDTVDLNKDGTISLDELQTYDKTGKLGLLGGGAPDAPKAMTVDELTEMRDNIAAEGGDTTALDAAIESFGSVDTDGDGEASFEEFSAFAKDNGLSLPGPSAGSPNGGTDNDGQEPPSLNQDELAELRDKIAAKGGDTEVLDAILSSFSEVDFDGDGQISVNELMSYMQQSDLSKSEDN